MKKHFLLVLLSWSALSFGWGERGHHVICEIATRMVTEKGLSKFLRDRGHTLGHVCNLPDSYWRNLGPISKEGDASHYMNPEKLGYKIFDLPTDFATIVKKAGKPATVVADNLGTNWWRTDQFFRRARDFAATAKKASPPKDKKEEQDFELPYNSAVFGMMANMGLMGHFVGDSSMPYHNTSDTDGWDSKRGGIHTYYETTSVNAMDVALVKEVESEALRLRAAKLFPPPEGSVVERMRVLSTKAMEELPQVERADELIAPSEKSPHKIPAKRPSEEKGAVAFHDIIALQMAKSALLLAAFWDLSYREGGAPSLEGYRSYQYPLTIEFIPLDYTK